MWVHKHMGLQKDRKQKMGYNVNINSTKQYTSRCLKIWGWLVDISFECSHWPNTPFIHVLVWPDLYSPCIRTLHTGPVSSSWCVLPWGQTPLLFSVIGSRPLNTPRYSLARGRSLINRSVVSCKFPCSLLVSFSTSKEHVSYCFLHASWKHPRF